MGSVFCKDSKKLHVANKMLKSSLLAFIFGFIFVGQRIDGHSLIKVDDILWDNDNCKGHVTDAICCQDKFCTGNTESECLTDLQNFDPLKAAICKWDGQKCLYYRDQQNNVCCQSKSKPGCSELMDGTCPEHYQVDENCCTEDGKKWTNLFNVTTSPGKVCCNAPCNDANEISGCARPDSCPSEIQARTLGSYGYGTVESSEVGINPEVFNQIVKYGKHYENVFATLPDNTNKYEEYKTPEITVDDIVDMLIKAMSNDGDVVRTDETLYTSPFGQYLNSKTPFVDKYINPNLYLRKALDPFSHFHSYSPSSLYGSGYNQVQYGKPPTSTDPTYGGYTSTDYSSGYGNPTYGGYTSMYGNPTYTSYGSYSHSGYGYQPPSYGYGYGPHTQPGYGGYHSDAYGKTRHSGYGSPETSEPQEQNSTNPNGAYGPHIPPPPYGAYGPHIPPPPYGAYGHPGYGYAPPNPPTYSEYDQEGYGYAPPNPPITPPTYNYGYAPPTYSYGYGHGGYSFPHSHYGGYGQYGYPYGKPKPPTDESEPKDNGDL